MKLGFYKNYIAEEGVIHNYTSSDIKKIQKNTLMEVDFVKPQSLKAYCSIDDFILNIAGRQYPISAHPKNTDIGEFIVAEKWINPYWKFKDRLYLPSESNPIGPYLIILSDLDGNKINTSIHQWSDPGEFKQGSYSKGCIRTRKEDIKEIFYSFDLNDLIKIK